MIAAVHISFDFVALCGYLGLTCSCYMTGIVWFAQVVHYPLLDRGLRDNFPEFAREYQSRTTWVVLPGLVGELISTACLLWLWPSLPTIVGATSLAAVWISTYFWLIPAHQRLKRGFDAAVHRSLVRRNLPRALLWTLRSGVMVWTVLTMP